MENATGTTRIAHGKLIDGTGAAAVADAVVQIEDGQITYAGPALEAPPASPDAVEIDANGGTILPGLVEAHYHPTYFNVAALETPDNFIAVIQGGWIRAGRLAEHQPAIRGVVQ